MKPKLPVHWLILFAPLALLTGCVGFNTALFMTKSNAGLDFDTKPPTVEINISRKESVVEPSFEGGKTPPVMASFSSKSGSGGGLGRFFFGVDQTFAGGDAAVTMAKLYDTNGVPVDDDASRTSFNSGISLSTPPKANTPAGKKGWLGLKRRLFALPEPGEVRPFFFGTDSQLGVKVGWNGVGGPYPDTVKIGYNRKEIAVAPVTFNPREDATHSNVVRIPSFLATVDSKVNAGSDVEVSWMQYFATGESASYLARQPGVRQAMHERADPLGTEKSKDAQAERNLQNFEAQGTNLAAQVATEVTRLTDAQLEAGGQAAIDSGLWPPANLTQFRTFNAAEQRRLLTATAANRKSPDEIVKLAKYLELLKAIH